MTMNKWKKIVGVVVILALIIVNVDTVSLSVSDAGH